jgi:hypothetical protein
LLASAIATATATERQYRQLLVQLIWLTNQTRSLPSPAPPRYCYFIVATTPWKLITLLLLLLFSSSSSYSCSLSLCLLLHDCKNSATTNGTRSSRRPRRLQHTHTRLGEIKGSLEHNNRAYIYGTQTRRRRWQRDEGCARLQLFGCFWLPFLSL